MHRTARLPEINRLESRHSPSHDPQMSLGFLNEVEQRIAVPISCGQSRGERALERRKRGYQVTSMVGRFRWRAQTAEPLSCFADSFERRLEGLVVNDRPAARDRALQQKAGELDQAATQEIVQRLSLAEIARERVGQTQARFPPWSGGRRRLVCVAFLARC
jgi:hypothetical protein